MPGFDCKHTCVFLLFFGTKEDRKILAVLKSNRKGYAWANQVALPGGHVDMDETPEEAVFRELEEELNIHPSHVDFVGEMGHFMTIRNKVLQVFVGFWNEKCCVEMDTREISRVLEIPVEDLVRTHREKKFHGRIPGVSELLYPHEDLVIWGVTARIFHYLIELFYPVFEKENPVQ